MAADNSQEREYHEPESYQGTSNDTLQSALIMAPSWLGSAIIHAVIILIFCQIPWSLDQDKGNAWQTEIKPKPEDIEDTKKPEPPKFDQDPDLTVKDLPVKDFAYVEEVEMDQLDVDVPGFNEDEPDEEPPLAIAKYALGDEGPAGHFHGDLANRGGAGRRRATLRYGGSPFSERAVTNGLGWLARAQEPDGHWDSRRWGASGNVDAAVTGLALLAFLGHGETDHAGDYRWHVYNALEWLRKHQAPNGSFKARFYTQGICTMAVSEAYALSRNPLWKSMAQKAINFCVENQNPLGGWDYNGNNPNRIDTSVTGWVVMALKSGVQAGLDVPPEAISRVKNWLKTSANAAGRTGYSYKPGTAGNGGTPAMTAVATLGRQFMGWKRNHPNMTKALAYLDKTGVRLQNMYETYYATLVMFQAGGGHWNRWNKAFRDPLIAKQVTGRGREFDGSWDPDVQYGGHGGRVYSTAMSAFCLEVYYRFMPMLK